MADPCPGHDAVTCHPLPPHHEGTADIAQVRVPGCARWTLPTSGYETEDHVVAGGEIGHARTDFLDRAGTFMSADDGETSREITGNQVLVGMAHARRRQPDQHLARLGGSSSIGSTLQSVFCSHRIAASATTPVPSRGQGSRTGSGKAPGPGAVPPAGPTLHLPCSSRDW